MKIYNKLFAYNKNNPKETFSCYIELNGSAVGDFYSCKAYVRLSSRDFPQWLKNQFLASTFKELRTSINLYFMANWIYIPTFGGYVFSADDLKTINKKEKVVKEYIKLILLSE